MRSVCVYCSSSNDIAPVYHRAAKRLGRLIGRSGWRLIYGGGMIGLMGTLADAVRREGGTVTGIIPRSLARKGIMYENAEEMIETKNLRDRKELMERRADAFIALPGGFGTLEEIAEIITLKQLRYHDKPVVFLDTGGFYSHLFRHFRKCFAEKFIDGASRDLFMTADTASRAVNLIRKAAAPRQNVP
ncbi:MAG TPA: TIGR00730 family Rossman fold protein [bacterium]|nr:TIGR00730 family Rossman fold protein [bacterium]